MSASAQDVIAVNRTAWAAGGLANKIGAGLIDGRVKVMYDYYTITGTEAAASTIKVGASLPKGASVLAIGLQVSAAQTSLTLSIGDGNSATRYATTHAALQTAGVIAWFSGIGYVIGTATSDNYILLTTAAATATAGVLYVIILYTTD